MAGRSWTIETHPQRDAIVAELVEGKSSLRNIAKRYDMDASCVSRYLNDRLMDKAAAVIQQKDKEEGDALINELVARDRRIEKLLDACDKYLQDADNPEEYDLFPRAWEMDVTYRTMDDTADDAGEDQSGKQRRPAKLVMKKESLQRILDRMDRSGYEPWEIKYRHADPRKLLLEASLALKATMELRAKLMGKLAEQTINITLNQYWAKMKAIIIKATESAPEVRAAIIEALEEGQDGH